LAASLRIETGGTDVSSDVYSKMTSLDVEENVDGPGSLLLRLPVTRNDSGDIAYVDDATFQPLTNITVVVAPDSGNSSCIFDGYILSQKIHMESALSGSWLEVYAQDCTWLMSLEEKTREWANVTDSNVADTIFQEYGFTPGPDNDDDDSGAYTDDNHTLMQRGTDYDFLRGLARRAGRFFRVACDDTPGERTGTFADPDLSGDPVATLRPNDANTPNVSQLEFEWDVMRPTSVIAREALFTDSSEDGASGDTGDSGLSPLSDQDLPTFAGQPMTVILTTPADDAGQLQRKAQAILVESQWFVKCTGEVDLSALQVVFRAGDIAAIETAGSTLSGS